MVSARSPPFKRQTPTNNPLLLEVWKRMYDDLRALHPKSRVLEIIGNRYGVSRQCVLYHLFPAYKRSQKNRPSKQWSYEKQNALIHKKRISYKARYMAARYHIDDLITKCFQGVAPKKTMTLEELSDSIHEMSAISFRPETIAGLLERYECHKGRPLLVQVRGCELPTYRLSNQDLS